MLRWLTFALAVWLLYLVRVQLPPFIAGAVLAYMLSRPVNRLATYIGRSAAIVFIYLTALTAFGYTILHFAPLFAEELVALFDNRQHLVENVVSQVASLTGWQLDVAQVMAGLSEQIQGHLVEKPTEILALGHLLTHSFLSLLIFLITSIYMTIDGKKLGRFALRFVPQEKRQEVSEMAGDIDSKLGKYLLGQAFLIAVMSLFAFVVLSYNHVHYALLLSVFIGVMEIVPFIGPMIALGVVLLVAGAQLGLSDAGIVIAILYAGRMVEDYLVVPKVVGHAVELPSLVTIFAVLAGEAIGGGLGMLLSIPVAAAIKVVLDRLLPPLPEAKDEGPDCRPPTALARLNSFGKFLKERLARLIKEFAPVPFH